MTTNPYFKSNYTAQDAEQKLVNSLIVEAHQIYGIDVEYLPRTLVNYDSFFGEDTHSAFLNSVTLEMYVKSYEGYNGGQFLSKFGLTISEELTLTCARKRFTDTVTSNHSDITRPREGDLIYIPFPVDERQRVFEISYVNQTEVFSQLGERYTWEIRCRVFDFNGEKFQTGNQDLDVFDNNYYSLVLELTPGVVDFSMGEMVTQTGGWEAEVVAYDEANNLLTVTNMKGSLDYTMPIIGTTGTRNIQQVDEAVENDGNMNDNQYLDNKEQVLVDFSENNPFSDF